MKSTHSSPADCFALLDDSSDGAYSRLYTGHAGMFACTDAADLPGLFERLQQALRQGSHAVGWFSYELGADLHGITPHAGNRPLAQIHLFERYEKLAAVDVDAWLAARGQGKAAGVAHLQPSITRTQFDAAFAQIQCYLEAGDTYQVNYTYRLHFEAYGPVFALYAKLRASQPAPFGALIVMPDGSAVLSRSPELFVRNEGGRLTAQPMKGTAAAEEAHQTDLASDAKSRAENLMIVDLLRNDLGRVAELGSVRVPRLFEVSRYGRVLQMTSTVEAQMRHDVSLSEMFRAIYPCGSVTGAPKRRTMQIRRELEGDARGLYTGAIGWFEAPRNGRQVGDFCLSVPIRTVTLEPERNGVCKGEMGVGAGIVHDSVAQQEFDECRLKAGFLTGLQADFELLETMQATTNGCRNLDRHLRRLQVSAQYFGFGWNEAEVRKRVQSACVQLPANSPHRLRLALNQGGQCSIQTTPLVPLKEPVKLLMASQVMCSDDLFLRHKTTMRAAYDAAWREAEAQGAFDILFFNERGDVTEGARSNVFVKLQGRWLTPPLSAGILPGVMRSVLLADPRWQANERCISLQDLRAAEEIVVCNSLRGVLRASLENN